MTPSLVLRAASSTPALVFSAAATTPSLAMENPFIRASILDVELRLWCSADGLGLAGFAKTDGVWLNAESFRWQEREIQRDSAPGQMDTRTPWTESSRMRVRKREREASRRKRTGCRETEPAGCCSAFKSCCGYSLHPHPHHTHTHSRRALLLTAM